MNFKTFLFALAISYSTFLQAQSNIFLERSFWQTKPNVEQVKEQISKGNNPTEKNSASFDAVVYAINNRAPIETIKFLLSLKGNEVDKVTHDGRNYLLWAGYSGNVELVQFLLEKGSDVRWKDDHGFDVVTFSAVSGNTNPKLYELYKAKGFELKNSQRNGANSLLLAAPSVKNISELDYFVKNGMSWDSTDENGNNIFLNVATKGNVEILQQLISKGIDYKKINNNNENALLVAAKGARRHSNTLETFKYLSNLGLNIKQTNKDENNILHYLAQSNQNWDVFEFFIQNGIDVNALNNKGETPYLLAISRRNNTIANKLFELTKNPIAENKEGYSALSYAVINLDSELVSKLVKNNAKLEITTQNNESLINLLFANFNSKKEKDFESILNLLTSQKVQPTVNSENGNTLFHILVNENHLELFEKAENLGVNIDQKNNEGLTPLHLAAMKSSDIATIKELVKLGANPKIKTEFEEDAKTLALENELLKVEKADLQFLN